MFIYLIYLDFFLSVNVEMRHSLNHLKNQALIANYSMKGFLIQCFSVVTTYSEENLFDEGLLF